jgi:hypothetical protein
MMMDKGKQKQTKETEQKIHPPRIVDDWQS